MTRRLAPVSGSRLAGLIGAGLALALLMAGPFAALQAWEWVMR